MLRRTGVLSDEYHQQVLITDTQYDSQYFRIADFPGVLTGGKNMFRLYGDRNLLEVGKELVVDVTDVNGNFVYHHVNNYIDNSGRIVIGIWIYPETPPGMGKVTITGYATRRPDGRSIPHGWKGRPSIRWERDVVIEPQRPNKTPIIFQTVPGVKLTENIREYLTQTYVTGTQTTSSHTGTLSYAYNGYGDAFITITGGTFNADMGGGLLEVPDPGYTLASGYTLNNQVHDPSETYPAKYTAYVESVLNSTTLKTSPYVLAVQSNNSAGGGTGKNVSTVNSTIPPAAFGPISNYTMSWQQDATYVTGSNNQQSFASITLKNLKPMVGKVHSIKTFMKSAGLANYSLLGEDILEERDFLINVDSELAYDRVGDFKNQDIVDTYWASESVNKAINFVNKKEDTQMISSMVITGSDQLTNGDQPNGQFIKVYNKTGISMYKDNEYQIQFKVVAEKYPTQTSGSKLEVYISGSNIGNNDLRQIGKRIVTLESDNNTVTDVGSFNQLYPESPAGGPFDENGKLIPEVTTTATSFLPNTETEIGQLPTDFDQRTISLTFTPSRDTEGHVVFAVPYGKWYISDISIEGANDFGFTPNHTFLEVPISIPQSDDILDFKFEFFNTNGDMANLTLTTQSMDFVGSNLYISGQNNILSGSVTIGNGIIMVGMI